MATTVPWDIFAEISHFLDPRALMKVARSSKEFAHHVSTNRSIWVDQVHNMLVEECLAPKSFLLRSLTLKELRAIATRPHRLMFAMEKPPRRASPPKPDLVLRSSRLEHLSIPGIRSSIQFHALLPGGRWLLTANSSDNESQLCCWDLNDLQSSPALFSLRKRLALFDGLESSPVITVQSDFPRQRVVIMARTCNYDGEYDIEIVYLNWPTSSDEGQQDYCQAVTFERVTRFVPGNIYIESAVMDGALVCMGSGEDWLLWNWKEDAAAGVTFKDADIEIDVVSIVLRPPHVLAISADGKIRAYKIPPLTPVSYGDPVTHEQVPLATSATYGTVRASKIMKDWVPPHMRSPPLLCLKTTVIPWIPTEPTAGSSSDFANPTILLDYSLPPDVSIDDHDASILPRMHYRGTGSLDWTPSYDFICGLLVERSFTVQRLVQFNLRTVPTFLSQSHFLGKDWDVMASKRRRNPAPGALILNTSNIFQRESAEELKDWVSICFHSGRVVMVHPHNYTVEIFNYD